MEQLTRIHEMERRREEATAAVRQMEEAVESYEAALEAVAVLEAYLGSEEWRQDLSDDERGLLPQDLKRGVLSEDGIWNLLEENHELALRIKDLSDKLLKG